MAPSPSLSICRLLGVLGSAGLQRCLRQRRRGILTERPGGDLLEPPLVPRVGHQPRSGFLPSSGSCGRAFRGGLEQRWSRRFARRGGESLPRGRYLPPGPASPRPGPPRLSLEPGPIDEAGPSPALAPLQQHVLKKSLELWCPIGPLELHQPGGPPLVKVGAGQRAGVVGQEVGDYGCSSGACRR